jgi:hypothetical protein
VTTKRCHIVASITLEVVTDYLEILAFVCQVKHSQRDFSLAACADDVKVLWKHTPDYLDLARECLFGTNMVGLLTRVGEDIYRFSHLTLQEYLAATCAVRLFGLDAQELLNQLQPLHSPWKRMVVQFAACLMEDEEVFEGLSSFFRGIQSKRHCSKSSPSCSKMHLRTKSAAVFKGSSI